MIETAPVTPAYLPRPGLRVENHGYAEACGAGSDSVGNAYRCFAGHGVYDPCWTDESDPDATAVICQVRPWEKRVYRFKLTQPLESFYGPPLKRRDLEPWGVELATGERCLAAQGAHDSVNGNMQLIVDYGCFTKAGKRDPRVLLRGIDRSHRQWRIRTASYNLRRNRYRLGPKVGIVKAWYARQDRALEIAASTRPRRSGRWAGP